MYIFVTSQRFCVHFSFVCGSRMGRTLCAAFIACILYYFIAQTFITDNVFSTKSWIKNKFQFEESVIDKQFGIPEDFDYIE